MRAINANVLICLIARDDPGQVAIAENFIKNGAWVSTVALAEAVWVLGSVYKLSPAALVKAIELLFEIPNLALEDADAVGDALTLFRANLSLGFSDCLIIQPAHRTGQVPGAERL